MNEQETIADIIAEKRLRAAEMEKTLGDQHSFVESLKDDADRIEAAHKRECGNFAALREALKAIGGLCDRLIPTWDGAIGRIKDVTEAALATPPRNCDMPLVVDGPADNNADKVWLAFKWRNPDVYFDVPGLLRCIDWLLAPATETEGGAK